ncbi:MAG TPA: GDSL-type esterase/lipase family protein [Opitutales bacterium]|nr:GDSL-type esterase/lipase family protein [Opitutales bacterium]
MHSFRQIAGASLVGLLAMCAGCATSAPASAPVAEPAHFELQPFVYAKGSRDAESDNPNSPRTGEVVLCLAGDSTVTYNAGYAAGLRACFDPRLQVVNFSHGGCTTASFRAQGRWAQVIAQKPDYVLIQFGHNDTANLDLPTYSANLARFVDEARAAGIKPILVTPVARRYWQSDGTIKDDLGPWVAAMQQVAADKKASIMQLHERAIDLYLKVGKAATDTWGLPKPDPNNPTVTIYDKTHFTAEASRQMGRVVADELKRVVPELGEYIH